MTDFYCSSVVDYKDACVIGSSTVVALPHDWNWLWFTSFFILCSLVEDFPSSEEVWNLVARRPIDERKSEVKKGMTEITGLQIC